MKKTIIIASAMLFAVSGAQAQFLSKMLDKAADKVVNKATGKTGQSSSQEKVDPVFLDPYYGSAADNRETFYPDGDVAAASASDLNSLLAKVPAVPSGNEVLRPTKAAMTAYIRGVRAVAGRADQLREAASDQADAKLEATLKAQQAAAQKAQQQAMVRAQQTQDYAAEAMKVYNNMSPQDMARFMELGEKLENMSDKQAEAYMKAHPEDMALMQKYAGQMMQLNAHRPTQQVDVSAFEEDMAVSEDNALPLINGALSFNSFAEQEAAKLVAEYNRILENGGNPQSVVAKAAGFRQNVANAWSKYLAELVAQVKKELLAQAGNGYMPDLYYDVDRLCRYLEDAYPDNLDINIPVLCRKDVVRQLKLSREEYLVRPENFLPSMEGLVLYKRNYETGNLFRFNGGKWTRMSDEFELDYEKKVEPAENVIVTSADGQRQAVVSGSAGFIRLPEGGVVYPNAVEVSGKTIRWSTFEKVEGQNPGEMDTWQIVECTYTL